MIFQRNIVLPVFGVKQNKWLISAKIKLQGWLSVKQDTQFWFDFITTHDSRDDISLQKQTVCIWHVTSVILLPARVNQKLITMFKQHMNTDLTASKPSVTLNFYKLNKYGMFQPYMVFCRNYKAFMIFHPRRTHKSTATLPVYIPQSITGSGNSGI